MRAMIMYVIGAILAVILLDGARSQSQETCNLATLTNTPRDGLLTFTELSAKYLRPATQHKVITEDGYILTLFHIPGDKANPLLMLPGIFDSADGYMIRGNRSLAIMLAERNFDVWATNFRGTRYSRAHTSLNPNNDTQYWEFSAHQYGVYDLSASIDYVLNATGQQQLSLVGFSEGTTAAFILGSVKPEYNDKVKAFVALAPIAFLQYVRGLLAFIIQLSPVINFLLPPSFVEFAGYCSMTKALINLICTQLVIGYELCYEGGFNAISGTDVDGIERGFFPTVIGHFPAGTSRMNLIHFAQISLAKAFRQYDYGATKNLMTYGSFTPPVYDVRKVTMRTLLVSGTNDPVSTPEDAEELRKLLPNVEATTVNRTYYNHLDHLWAHDAYDIEYPYVFDYLDKYALGLDSK